MSFTETRNLSQMLTHKTGIYEPRPSKDHFDAYAWWTAEIRLHKL